MSSLAKDYFGQALKLLPQGLIWGRAIVGRLAGALWMSAGQLAGAHRRAENLIYEASPQTAVELIEEWEKFAGLPDECTPIEEQTLAERQDAVVEKLTGMGSMSVASFYELARRLGYDIEITEYRPFVVGRSVCGGPDVLGSYAFDAPNDPENGEAAGEAAYNARFYWRVTVKGPRLHWFRAGRDCAGERLGWYTPARDLECFLNRRKPAHTIILFDYEEVL